MFFINKIKLTNTNKYLLKSLKRNYSLFSQFNQNILSEYNANQTSELGSVVSVGDGIARIQGCQKIQAGELVHFLDKNLKKQQVGMALNLESESVGVVIFGDDRLITQDQSVCRSYKLFFCTCRTCFIRKSS